MIDLRCLTLTQPWASLVDIWAKHYETRGWSTSYRGPLGIHAAKGWTRDDKELCGETPFMEVLHDAGLRTIEHGIGPLDRVRGHILCVVDLVDCIRVDGDLPRTTYQIEPPAPFERDFGNYAGGRFAWILKNRRRLATPVPAKGALGLWTPLDDARRAVDEQIAKAA